MRYRVIRNSTWLIALNSCLSEHTIPYPRFDCLQTQHLVLLHHGCYEQSVKDGHTLPEYAESHPRLLCWQTGHPALLHHWHCAWRVKTWHVHSWALEIESKASLLAHSASCASLLHCRSWCVSKASLHSFSNSQTLSRRPQGISLHALLCWQVHSRRSYALPGMPICFMLYPKCMLSDSQILSRQAKITKIKWKKEKDAYRFQTAVLRFAPYQPVLQKLPHKIRHPQDENTFCTDHNPLVHSNSDPNMRNMSACTQ